MTGATGDAGVVVERVDTVLRVTLDRPERKNALSKAAMQTIADAVEGASVSGSGVRVVRVAASGPDFCAGGDLSEGAAVTGAAESVDAVARDMAASVQRLVSAFWFTDLPVVAGVRGRAVGLGSALVLVADLAVAGTSARLRFPFNQRGFTPDSGASWLLPRAVGVARAKRALLLGDEIDAPEALRAGLVADVVDDARVDSVADDWAHRLASGATVAVGLTKRLVREGLDRHFDDGLVAEVDAMKQCMATRDFREGFEAFAGRRRPAFEGR